MERGDGARPAETRKTVTVLFCDLVGSTGLGEQLDAEVLRQLLARYFDVVSSAVQLHGGTVEKFIGDAVMAVFGVPVMHEDDATRAVRAAWTARRELDVMNREVAASFGVRLEVRMGIETGEVVTGTLERLATGDVVNVAARLEQAAGAGELLIGDSTLRLVHGVVEVAPLGPLLLKGKALPVRAHQLINVRAADEPRGGQDVAMVDRVFEMRLLRDALEAAVRERCCRMITIVGPAGIGKSRLIRELIDTARDAEALSARCLPYGAGITYWPIVEILGPLRSRLATLPLDAPVLPTIDRLLTGEATSNDEIAWAFRKVLEQLAHTQPVVLVLDDIQWAEETLLDLVQHLVFLSRGAPIFVVCLARPELLEKRSDWSADIRLQPLTPVDAARLLDQCMSGMDIDADVSVRILNTAEGNPLFVYEMSAVAQASKEDEVVVPPTLRALLAARLDQLDDAERQLLEVASVEGEVFHRGALSTLLPEEQNLMRRLTSLVRKELIAPHAPELPGEDDAYRFRHLLLRDAAYERMPKAMRAQRHEGFARWLEETAPGRPAEVEGIAAYHLERAYRYRAELTPLAAEVLALRGRSGRMFLAGGRRAAARGDLRAAVTLLTRSAELLSEERSEQPVVLEELAEALITLGDLSKAEGILRDVLLAATTPDLETLLWRARVAEADLRMHQGAMSIDEVIQTARSAAGVFEQHGDELGLALALYCMGKHGSGTGASIDAEAVLRQALDHARRANAPRQEAETLAWLLIAWWFGDTSAAMGIERCQEALAHAPDLTVEAHARIELGCFLATQGDFDAARSSVARGLALLHDLGHKADAAAASQECYDVEMLAGDPAAAEACLRPACETLEAMGDNAVLSTRLGCLAEALYAQNRLDEAEQVSRKAQSVSDPNDHDAEFRWRSVLARVLARRGELDMAEALIGEAGDLISATNWLNERAAVHEAHAEILELWGRPAAARAHLDAAIALYRQKGNRVAEQRAPRRLGSAAR